MICPAFSASDRAALEAERYSHPHPKVQRKLEAVYLKSLALPHHLIYRICGISKPTLVRYLRTFEQGGLDGLKQLGYAGRPNRLHPHAASLESHFRQHPPATCAQAQAVIAAQTGVRRGLTQVRAFLRRLQMKYRKCGFVPGKADTPEKQVEQAEFLKKKLQPKLAEAQAGQRVVLFLDAAHFVYGAFLGSLWCFARVFLRSPSGRQRFNVLGALDAVTRQVHLFTNETYITAQSVCALLSQLAAFYGPRKLPLTLFLDKARYQRCALVQAHAQALGMELEFLPTYSPNLNLIERYWRWVKKQCLNAQYHADFATMKTAILRTTATAHHEHLAALASLLTWNFQLFPKTQVTI